MSDSAVERVFVGVGANISPETNIARGLDMLGAKVRILALSMFYRTAPLGGSGQPFYINGVVKVADDLAPPALRRLCKEVEKDLGRADVTDRYAPRPLDLDILLYGMRIIRVETLTIPDPQIADRPFLAVPLHELAPGLVVPGSAISLAALARRHHSHDMEPLGPYTQGLRRLCGLAP